MTPTEWGGPPPIVPSPPIAVSAQRNMLPIPATRGDLALLIDRLINLLDATEDTDSDRCAEDEVMLGTAYTTGPGDADDAEPSEDDEPGTDDEPDFDNERFGWGDQSAFYHHPRVTTDIPVFTVLPDGSCPALGLAWVPIRGLEVRR